MVVVNNMKMCAKVDICFLLLKYGGCANAVPHYQKFRIRTSHVWGDRRFQLGQVQCTSLHPEEPPA